MLLIISLKSYRYYICYYVINNIANRMEMIQEKETDCRSYIFVKDIDIIFDLLAILSAVCQ